MQIAYNILTNDQIFETMMVIAGILYIHAPYCLFNYVFNHTYAEGACI